MARRPRYVFLLPRAEGRRTFCRTLGPVCFLLGIFGVYPGDLLCKNSSMRVRSLSIRRRGFCIC